MIKIENRQVTSTEGKLIRRINTNTYFKRAIALPSDLVSDFEEVDYIPDDPRKVEEAKQKLLNKILEYDVSGEVNGFLINGKLRWLDKATRVGLMNSLSIERNVGKETSVLWFEDECININCDAAILLLSAIELYAVSCYNKTSEHKIAVKALNTLSDIENYDYTTGYPDKLTFTIEQNI